MHTTPERTKSAAKAAAPQGTSVMAKAPARVASGLSSRQAANGTRTDAASAAVRPANGTAPPAFSLSTQHASSKPVVPSEPASRMPKATPSSTVAVPISASSPGTLSHEKQPVSCYRIGSTMGSFGGGVMGPSGAGGAPSSSYGTSFMQRSGGSNCCGGGFMFGEAPSGAADASIYGEQNSIMLCSTDYGNSTMGHWGHQKGSMYGVGGPMGSMYGVGGPTGSMYGMGGPMGSMYGVGAPTGSMYGMGGPMGSMGGGGYGVSGFGGSLYGGSMLGATGSLYGTGGSLYGSNHPNAVMSSIYGCRTGSMFGGFGSIYQVEGPHTSLGVVRKQSIPGFSYCFGPSLGSTGYCRNFIANSASPSRGGSMRDTIFRTSVSMKASDCEVEPKAKGDETARQDSSTDAGKDRKTIQKKPEGDEPVATSTASEPAVLVVKDHTPVTEASKSPTAARKQRSGDAAIPAAVLSSDFRIHNVVVLEQAGANNATVAKKDEVCVVKGKSYAMDEVVVYNPADRTAVESRHLNDLIEHVLAGHNAAILVAHDGKAVAAATATVEATMSRLVEELKRPARTSYAGLSMSMCSFPNNTTACDLLVDSAKAAPLKTGNSPLFGPTVVGLKSEPVESGADFEMLYDAALKRGEKEAMMVCIVVVKQMRQTPGEGKEEVFLSSVFIGVSQTGPKAFHDVIDKAPASAHEVFRYAIDGPTVCVHVVAVREDMADAKILEEAAKVGAIQNSAARSGNVRRFIDFTEDQLSSMLKRRDASTGPEKADLDSHVERLKVVLQDAKKLLSDPRNTVPHVYQTEVEKSTEMTPAAANTHAAPETEASGEADDKPRSTNIATVVIADACEAPAYSAKGTIVTAGGRSFAVDEVVISSVAKSKVMETKATGQVLAAFLKGYNGAVVTVECAAATANVMESPTMNSVFAAVANALANPGCKGVRVSIALVRESGVACDLTGSAAELKPVEVSSSPLFGPVLSNAALHRISAEEELQRIVDKARVQVKSLWDAQSAVHLTVVHCFAEGDDVYVSSLLVSSSTACKMYEQVLHQQAHSVHELFRYAFGGAATTAFVVSMSRSDPVAEVVASLSTQHAASAVRNRSPRQGSIKNFLSYAKASLDRRRERLETLPDGSAEKATVISVMAPMERMLSDHEKVMTDPAKNFPRAYAAEGRSDNETKSEAPAAVDAARQEGSGALTGSGSRDLPRGQQPHQSPLKSAVTTLSSRPEKPASAFTEPRVVAFVEREVAVGATHLLLGMADYKLDEIVRRMKSSCGTTTGPSVNLVEMKAHFAGVHNCSLISASSVKDALSAEEPVWMYFQQCLNNALAGGKPGEEVCVDLSFAVVSAEELVADLLSDENMAEPEKLEIASSPIYGPRVRNTCTVAARNADELARLLDKVHTRAERYLSEIRTGDLMMVGTGLLRRLTNEGDVLVASLMGTLAGLSVKAYKEAMEKAPVARRTLLSSAYGGPSATMTMLNVGVEDESAQEMVSTAIAISKKQRNLVSRTGSVQAFVRYTEGTMKREQVRSAAASGESKDRHLQKINRLQPVVEDHKKLLLDFTAPIPAYPATRPHSSNTPEAKKQDAAIAGKLPTNANTASGSCKAPRSTKTPTLHRVPEPGTKAATPMRVHATKKEQVGPNRIQTVVVVTPNRKTPSSTAMVPVTRTDDTHIAIQTSGEQRTVECDEAVSRLDHFSPVRSDKLSAVVQQFVGGFNTAVLCCDVGGSSAGLTACTKIVHDVMDRKPENSELYMSIVAVKDDGNAKDLLAPRGSSGYAPMKVSNSLIFGPWVHGATTKHLTSVAQFDDAFAARAEAAQDGAVCIVSLALKAMEKKDVVLSSLLLSLSTQLNAHAAVVNAPLKMDRKLYQYALHGSCFSIGLLGLPDKVNEKGLVECLDTYATMRTIENRPMRNGSVRRFLAYSTNATADMKSRAEYITDERQRGLYAQRIASLEKMVGDARALIESPEGQVPITYI
ncbi:hypothetical protein CUR178_02075 [Leishmania enriettii]|uniref:Uncharacterized protein n=1 Tax=Leishmania enriettii TaxID=5663 RepID=A0A836H4M9_LEIEN|nr:hypothetical protein CUR178_02075 [Leishmania enriettii]